MATSLPYSSLFLQQQQTSQQIIYVLKEPNKESDKSIWSQNSPVTNMILSGSVVAPGEAGTLPSPHKGKTSH